MNMNYYYYNYDYHYPQMSEKGPIPFNLGKALSLVWIQCDIKFM